MQKKETAIEVKVGALVVFSLALLGVFIYLLGDFSFSKGFEFKVDFENAGGLKPGADVAIAGLHIGNVKSLEFVKNPRPDGNPVVVRAHVMVQPSYADSIRKDSEFFITTRGVLGEPYIEIVTSNFDTASIVAGDVLRGVDPPRLDLLVSRAQKLLIVITDLLEDPDTPVKEFLANVSQLVKTVNDILTGNRKQIDEVIAGANTTVNEASMLLRSLNLVVEDGKDIKLIVSDLGATARNARRATAELSSLLSETRPLVADARGAVKNVRELTDDVSGLVKTNEQKINNTITNVEKSSERLVVISEDAQVVIKKVKSGEGAVGALLQEREVYDDLKEILRQIKRKPWKIIWKE
jgi:phospholipid/cholesterol/gamma-HCH transport system substrate-binding protein